MRVLFITAYFPPCEHGWGYMRLCESVADYLHGRGHSVQVLTSYCRDGGEQKAYPVHRLLALDPDWHISRPAMVQLLVDHPQRERHALEDFDRITAAFKPEIVFIWHGNGLPRRLFQEAESMEKAAAVYYLANYLPEYPDEYLDYLREPGRTPRARLVKALLRPLAEAKLRLAGKPVRLEFPNTIHVSDHVRSRLAGKALIGPNAVTIPNGVLPETYERFSRSESGADGLQFIYAGRISPEKGVLTLIEAARLLKDRSQGKPFSLTIIGDGPQHYRDAVQEAGLEAGLQETVRFCPPVDLDQYRALLAGHDVLVYPSIWDEPLSSTMMEAMAFGLLVIGTEGGGSAEILEPGVTGLVVPPDSPDALAGQMAFALDHPDARRKMAAAGRDLVRTRYNLRTSFERIEAYLAGLIPEGQ